MRLRVRTDRFTTMIFAALGLGPLSACGGATTPNVNGAGGAGGDSSTVGAGGSSTTGSMASGTTVGTTGSTSTGTTGSTSTATTGTFTSGTTGPTTTGTTGAGGAGGSFPFPCIDSKPFVHPKSGYFSCANGSVHRSFKSVCPSTIPRPGFVAPDAGFNSCTRDTDCPGPYGYCTTGGQIAGYYCTRGCTQDTDCAPSQICLCGDPVGRCVTATCTVDADCGPGLMCSTYNSAPGCMITTFGCQTPNDQCGGDADCPVRTACSIQGGRRICAPYMCVDGRPFLIGAEMRVAEVEPRGDWSTAGFGPDVSRLTAAERATLASAWTEVARMEHASIAAFARFTMHLMSVGAPAFLVERSNAAMADETLHAKLAFAIASSYAGHDIGPGPLDIDGALSQNSFRDILVTTIREGCIGETVAAVEATEALEHVADPAIRRALQRIAADETRHAELAWQFVGWALERGGEDARNVAQPEFERAHERSPEGGIGRGANEALLLAGGILPERLRRAVHTETMNDIVLVCARALLGRSVHGARAA